MRTVTVTHQPQPVRVNAGVIQTQTFIGFPLLTDCLPVWIVESLRRHAAHQARFAMSIHWFFWRFSLILRFMHGLFLLHVTNSCVEYFFSFRTWNRQHSDPKRKIIILLSLLTLPSLFLSFDCTCVSTLYDMVYLSFRSL